MRYDAKDIGAALLAWYDGAARMMPWRVGPADRAAGVRPDPYRVWLSEVMLQQTTVAAVEGYFRRFTARWPDVAALAAAEDAEVMAEWAGLGYYARARNLLKCARAVATDHGGRFPATAAALHSLPGVGPYTAGAVAAIAFDEPAVVVDGNVERVVARLFAVQTPLPAAKPELVALATRLTPAERPGDHAQAMMDLGATICTPRNPACPRCPLAAFCAARAQGIAADLPRKAPKAAKPLRRGIAYVVRRSDGAMLLERRPDRGLLGGMLGWPGSDWSAAPDDAPPLPADWHDPGAEVRHVFTHFELRLALRLAHVGLNAVPDRGTFIPAADFRPASLPTVMRKVWDAAARHGT
ncbi:A/G-specific adenine glycosylase [Ruixingdingia sedimenti]|uniref:Adenine DNA glycosylase n=1 Tax=Ruixingdingia sedimenti TaxID=3073604 RepID=A0ABU1F9M4_9RHOB|nr:A/G-specific adenine glycosylase [Xinfangfangia sp. LG-4]MDR5653581.1 A/G-specific adenine glycosylase [Xinfangfangia sp. LG-4]